MIKYRLNIDINVLLNNYSLICIIHKSFYVQSSRICGLGPVLYQVISRWTLMPRCWAISLFCCFSCVTVLYSFVNKYCLHFMCFYFILHFFQYIYFYKKQTCHSVSRKESLTIASWKEIQNCSVVCALDLFCVWSCRTGCCVLGWTTRAITAIQATAVKSLSAATISMKFGVSISTSLLLTLAFQSWASSWPVIPQCIYGKDRVGVINQSVLDMGNASCQFWFYYTHSSLNGQLWNPEVNFLYNDHYVLLLLYSHKYI